MFEFIIGILFWQFACFVMSIMGGGSVRQYCRFTLGIFNPILKLFVILRAKKKVKEN